MNNFNSHAHVERDHGRVGVWVSNADFNSHAHVERDAQLLADNISSINNFNSHAHVERDNRLMGRYMGEFISTHTLTWSVT